MTDITELRSKLDALRRARYTGLKEIEYLGNGIQRRVQYRSDQEMASAIAALERQIEETQGASRVRSVRVICDKGWE